VRNPGTLQTRHVGSHRPHIPDIWAKAHVRAHIKADVVALGTPDFPEVAVDLQEVLAPGLEVKPIDILSDEGEMRKSGFEIDQSLMAGVEGQPGDEIAAPVVELQTSSGSEQRPWVWRVP